MEKIAGRIIVAMSTGAKKVCIKKQATSNLCSRVFACKRGWLSSASDVNSWPLMMYLCLWSCGQMNWLVSVQFVTHSFVRNISHCCHFQVTSGDVVQKKKAKNPRIYCCNCAKGGHFAFVCSFDNSVLWLLHIVTLQLKLLQWWVGNTDHFSLCSAWVRLQLVQE